MIKHAEHPSLCHQTKLSNYFAVKVLSSALDVFKSLFA